MRVLEKQIRAIIEKHLFTVFQLDFLKKFAKLNLGSLSVLSSLSILRES